VQLGALIEAVPRIDDPFRGDRKKMIDLRCDRIEG